MNPNHMQAAAGSSNLDNPDKPIHTHFSAFMFNVAERWTVDYLTVFHPFTIWIQD